MVLDQYGALLVGTESVLGGSGWYPGVQGQCNSVLLRIKLYWVNKVLVCLYIVETLPKAQWTRGLSSDCQSNFLKSYHKS